MNPYAYLNFAIMPYAYENDVVSPNRPLGLHKKIYKLTHTSPLIQIAPGEMIEGLFMDGYINNYNSEHLALFYSSFSNQNANNTLDKTQASKRLLENKPLVTVSTCYIGGYVKITNVNQTSGCLYESRYYEPTVYDNANYTNVVNEGPSSITSFGEVKVPLYISCMPSELRAKRFYGLGYQDFHTIAYNWRIKNNGTDIATIKIEGAWYLETYEASGASPVSFTQDTKCPYKLAEYVFGKLRNTNLYTFEPNVAALKSSLPTLVPATIATIVTPWQILANNLTLTGSQNNTGPKEETDQDWEAKPLIWNP